MDAGSVFKNFFLFQTYIALVRTPQIIVETTEQIAFPPSLANRIKDDNIAVGIPIIGPPNSPAIMTVIIRMLPSKLLIVIANNVDKDPKIKKITMQMS